MNLSAEQYATIINSLRGPASSDAADKRRARRVVHRARVPVVLDQNTDRQREATLTVRDISPRGIGLLHSERLARGTTFVICIEHADAPPVSLLCTVAHCRLQPGGVYSVGAEFTCTLNQSPAPSGDAARADLERIRRSVLA